MTLPQRAAQRPPQAQSLLACCSPHTVQVRAMAPNASLSKSVETNANDVHDGFYFEEIHQALGLGIDNRIAEAQAILDKRAGQCLYHSYGGALTRILGALSLDKGQLREGMNILKKTMVMIDQRKRKSWTRYLWKQDYDLYTDEEVHAELVHCEVSIFLAAMTTVENQSFLGIVNAALYIRSAYKGYQECLDILKTRKVWSSEASKIHFESGVRLAIGCFDVAISYFPGKFVRLLEYVGFSGDRQFGMAQVTKALDLPTGLRYAPAVGLMCAQQGFFENVFGLGESDWELFELLANKFIEQHPQSGYAILLKGLLAQIKGNLEYAIECYESCIGLGNLADQLDNFCRLTSVWAHIFLGQWAKADPWLEDLEKSAWSPAACAYIRCLCMFMVADEEEDAEKKAALMSKVCEKLAKVPGMKRNFGGKKAFHEKLVVENSVRYSKCPESMMLPIYDFAYIFNIFQMSANRQDILERVLEQVDSKEAKLDVDSEFYHDHLAYLTFFRGVCCKQLNRDEMAMSAFHRVVDLEHEVTFNKHLAPQATYEIGHLHRKQKHVKEAKEWYSRAKHYSGYTTEVMVNYRATMAMDSMKTILRRQSTREMFNCALASK